MRSSVIGLSVDECVSGYKRRILFMGNNCQDKASLDLTLRIR